MTAPIAGIARSLTDRTAALYRHQICYQVNIRTRPTNAALEPAASAPKGHIIERSGNANGSAPAAPAAPAGSGPAKWSHLRNRTSSLQDLILLALRALKEATSEPLTKETCTVAVVGVEIPFRVLDEDELSSPLAELTTDT